jgi:hypothetical protein
MKTIRVSSDFQFMKEKDKVATTVKIPASLYDDFKVLGIRHKISLQTLVEKCVNLFVSDEAFRATIASYSIPKVVPDVPINIPVVITSSVAPTT